jgi:hypothetical protein
MCSRAKLQHDMTESNLRDAFDLLDSAIDLLHNDRRRSPEEFRRELRALTLEFDLLRVRLRQPAAEELRN